MSQINQSFEIARSLPLQVQLSQVEAMILGFPIPATTPVWKSNTLKVATVGVIGSAGILSYWQAEDEVPQRETQPQIQVPISKDTIQKEPIQMPLQKADSAEFDVELHKEAGLVNELVEPLRNSKPRIEADTDSVSSVRPTQKPKELFPRYKGGLVNASDIDSSDLFKGEEANEHSLEHEECECNCNSTDVVEWNKHIDTGVMSFFFSCDNDDVELEKEELKDFERELKRELKRIKLFDKEIRIDFHDHSTVILNGQKLSGMSLEAMLDLFKDHEVFPSAYRKILMDKQQIWVGDFDHGQFSGTASGFNVKKSMADEWLEE